MDYETVTVDRDGTDGRVGIITVQGCGNAITIRIPFVGGGVGRILVITVIFTFHAITIRVV